jgi:hypothetical protein
MPSKLLFPAALSLCASLTAQGFDPGPAPTRELFPLELVPLVYQPIAPKPVGEGKWQVSFHSTRGNVFEFSDVIKNAPPPTLQGRLALSRSYWEGYAAAHPGEPFVFWFDEELLRHTLSVRYGLTPRTDLFIEGAWVSHTGGTLDQTIEEFHRLFGFQQWGRDLVAQNQLVIATMAKGKVTFYSEEPFRMKPQDPLVGIVQELFSGPEGGLSFTAVAKPPLTTTYDVYRSGLDLQAGVSGWYEDGGNHTWYGGAAYTHRSHGSAAFEEVGYTDELGAHAGVRWRVTSRVQPFLQLYYLSGFARRRDGARFDLPAFEHDLGLHVFLTKGLALTFRYLNNISHNENTMDMAFAVGVTVKL